MNKDELINENQDEYLETLSEADINTYKENITEGKKAHDIMIVFYNWIFTSIHLNYLMLMI